MWMGVHLLARKGFVWGEEMKWELKTFIAALLVGICFIPYGFLFSLYVIYHVAGDKWAKKNRCFYYEWHSGGDLGDLFLYHVIVLNFILAVTLGFIAVIAAGCTGNLV